MTARKSRPASCAPATNGRCPREDQEMVNKVETELFNGEEREIPSSVIGEKVMHYLKDLDQVAYVRFASIYREFKDVNTFMDELKKMLDK